MKITMETVGFYAGQSVKVLSQSIVTPGDIEGFRALVRIGGALAGQHLEAPEDLETVPHGAFFPLGDGRVLVVAADGSEGNRAISAGIETAESLQRGMPDIWEMLSKSGLPVVLPGAPAAE